LGVGEETGRKGFGEVWRRRDKRLILSLLDKDVYGDVKRRRHDRILTLVVAAIILWNTVI
jgi:hypothetical protein